MSSQARRHRGVRPLFAVLVAMVTVVAVLAGPADGAGAQATPTDTSAVDSTFHVSGEPSVPMSTMPQIPLAQTPNGLEVLDELGLVVVSEFDVLEFFDLAGNHVATVGGVAQPAALEVSGNRLYAYEPPSQSIVVVDLDTFTVAGHLGSGLLSTTSIVAQDGMLYVGGFSPRLAVIDPTTGATTSLVPMIEGSALWSPTVLPGGAAGSLVTVEPSGRVAKVQVAGDSVTVTAYYQPVSSEATSVVEPQPGTENLWLGGSHSVRLVDLSTMSLVGSFIDGYRGVLAARGGSSPLVAVNASFEIAYHSTESPFPRLGGDATADAGGARAMAFSADGERLYAAGRDAHVSGAPPYLQIVFPDGTPGGGFHPLPGTRLLDTRTGIGVPVAPLGSGQALDLQVNGRASIPLTGVDSVVLNMTVTEPTGAGFLTTYPTGLDRPTASSMNFVPGQTVANLVTVPVGDGGKVRIYNSFGSTHVVADVAGWYDQTGEGATYHPLAPGRVLDTRDGTNTTPIPLGPGAERTVTVAGQKGVPSTGASAVVLNLTATGPTAGTYVTAWPTGQDRPLASNLNLPAGDTRPNLAVVPLGPDGSVTLYNHAGSTALVADVVGWFGDQASNGSTFVAVGPVRLVDSRDFGAALGPGTSALLGVGFWLPSDTTAVVLNVTAVDGTEPGWLVVYPSGIAPPLASNLNWSPGQVNPNQVVVPVGSNGAIEFYNHNGWVDVVVDLAGIYVG